MSRNMDRQTETREEKFFLDNFNSDMIFRSMDRTDYYFLHYIRICASRLEEGEKLYLATLAEAIGMPMTQLSKAIGKLQDKAYIIWKTDLNAGKTYVELSSHAETLMEEEYHRMKTFYETLQKEIGEEDLGKMVQLMKRIREIIGRIDEESA